MNSEDDLKSTFLASLTDQQLGFFHAHEYSVNLEDLLCDEITPKQMGLFMNWKDSKESETSISSVNYQSNGDELPSTSVQPNIPNTAIPNRPETDLRELMRDLELRLESKIKKEVQSQKILLFDESTQTGKIEDLEEVQQSRRNLIKWQKRCKILEEENLSLKQKNEKVTTELNDYMRKQESLYTPIVCSKCDAKNDIKLDKSDKISKSPTSNGIQDTFPIANDLPNCTNVLILGEMGVGKSTFINGMVNYLRFNNIERAEQFGPDVLVPSRFILFDDNGEEHDIAVKPKENPQWDTNEAKGVGESATQKPMSYTFAIPGKKEKYIRIIDTPGIGDTRGINQDERNFEEIMSHIADYPKIHVILFLVAPSESRLRVSFRYGIQELLARLHRAAVENVVFGFTKSRANQYKPGESYATLQSLLTTLGKDGTTVPLNRENSYFFDSESFRYLAAKKQGFKFSDNEHRDYKESWQKAVSETQRMFKYIFTLQPHNVNETLCVNNTKKVIQMLSKPLGDITKNILTNESLLMDKKKEVEEMKYAGGNLENRLWVDQITLGAEELSSPQTVCTAQSCVEHGTVGGKAHTTIYKTVCDPDCAHTGIQTEVLPNPNLSDCKAFENGICKKCKCSWELHMHIRSRTNEVKVRVIDDNIEKELSTNLSKQEEADKFMKFLKTKIEHQTAHKKSILENCAEFAAFVAQNSLLAVNDAYNEYLKYLIKEEKEKENSGDSAILAELERYANAYEEQSKLLIDARKQKRNQQKSVAEINKMINDLKETDFCGRFLEEIQYLQVVSVRVSAQNRSKKIVLTNWKEDLKWLLEKPAIKAKQLFK